MTCLNSVTLMNSNAAKMSMWMDVSSLCSKINHHTATQFAKNTYCLTITAFSKKQTNKKALLNTDMRNPYKNICCFVLLQIN